MVETKPKSISEKHLEGIMHDCPVAQGFRCGINGEMCFKPGNCVMVHWLKNLGLLTVPEGD